MALTTASDSVQKWSNDFTLDWVEGDMFTKFMGPDENAIIQVKEELGTGPGDQMYINLVNELDEGVTLDSSTLEGNETDLTQRRFKITIRQYRKAVLVPDFENKKSPIDLLNAAKAALSQWQEKFGRKRITRALGSISVDVNSAGVAYSSATEANKDTWLGYNSGRVLFGSTTSNLSAGDHSASLLNVDATNDKMSKAIIELAKRQAEFVASPAIRPAKPRKGMDRTSMFVLFINPYQHRDLDENLQTLHQNAMPRSKDNPIFTQADFKIANVAVYVVPDMPTAPGAGAAGIDVAPAFLCGAQALALAWGKRPTAIKSTRDYGDKSGVGIKMWAAWEKILFGTGANRDDSPAQHGVYTIWTASVAD